MRNALSNIFSSLASQIVTSDDPPMESKPMGDLMESIEQARRDWMVARDYFDNVTDPDLIDVAIYNIEAAEKRYMYLLKLAKAGVQGS